MYRPHAAREDTDLFPKLKDLVSAHDTTPWQNGSRRSDIYGGEDGFEKMVDRVARLEQQIGIHELSQFTPKA